LLIGGILAFIYFRYDELQLTALDAVGMAPTVTPMSGDLANQGMEYYSTGDVDNAMLMLERALQQQPNSIDYLYEYGRMLLDADMVDEAIPIADRAIQVAPDDPRGYAIKAQTLMWTEPAEAIQIAIRGQDADPNFAPLYAVSGVAYTNLGRWQEGVRNGAQAIELDPNDPFVQLAYNFPMTYTGRYQEAIDSLERAISINPNLTTPYFYLAALYGLPQVNQPEMAIATYEHIISLDPTNAKAYLRICETYARVDEADFQKAQEYCDDAIEIVSNYASAYRQRGQMQYNRRNYEGSIESFQECVDLGSDEIECWYLRGLAHFWLGECDQAWDVLQEAQIMAAEQGIAQSVVDNIEAGLYNITQKCTGYANQPTPTPAPPTPVPLTPIGGFG
jgi:tetratricopeptide (TPR) repeat protein